MSDAPQSPQDKHDKKAAKAAEKTAKKQAKAEQRAAEAAAAAAHEPALTTEGYPRAGHDTPSERAARAAERKVSLERWRTIIAACAALIALGTLLVMLWRNAG